MLYKRAYLVRVGVAISMMRGIHMIISFIGKEGS